MKETGVWCLGREDPPGEGHGNPLQYSCLENPVDRGAWWARVHGVTESQIRLSDRAHIHTNKWWKKGRKRERKKGKYFPPVLVGSGVTQGPLLLCVRSPSGAFLTPCLCPSFSSPGMLFPRPSAWLLGRPTVPPSGPCSPTPTLPCGFPGSTWQVALPFLCAWRLCSF